MKTKTKKDTKQEQEQEQEQEKENDSSNDSDNDNDNDTEDDSSKKHPKLKKESKKLNKRTLMANCTLNVVNLSKYCKRVLEKDFIPNKETDKLTIPDLDIVVGPTCEVLFEYIVKSASSYAKKSNVPIECKGKDIGNVNKYNVTLSCVRQAVNSDDSLCESLGFAAQRFDSSSRDNTNQFLSQDQKVVDSYIENVLKSTQVNFEPDAKNLICFLVETSLAKMLKIANEFRKCGGGNTVRGFKHFKHSTNLFFKDPLLSVVQRRIDDVEKEKVKNKDEGEKKGKKTSKTSKTSKKSKGTSKDKDDSDESNENSDNDNDNDNDSNENSDSDSDSDSDNDNDNKKSKSKSK